jgi:dipeptidyl aminopeptidase/acylaminoacyl peptidase
MEDQHTPDVSEAEAERPDFRALPLVYSRSGMSEVTRLSDIAYKRLGDGTELKMDVYYPDTYDGQALLPVVLFVHGDGPPEMLRDAKDWACYVGWGELVASAGLVAVTFNHRSTEMLQKVYESAADVDDLIAYVRAHSHDLGIDAERLGIWTCSAGSYRGLRAALRGSPSYVRCAVSYYGVVDLKVFYAGIDDAQNPAGEQQEQSPPRPGEETFKEFAATTYLRQNASVPPLLIVRAGLDDPDLNAGIDKLVQAAIERNLDVDVLNHATGHHAFDMVDNNSRSREIIRATLEFLKTHLP